MPISGVALVMVRFLLVLAVGSQVLACAAPAMGVRTSTGDSAVVAGTDPAAVPPLGEDELSASTAAEEMDPDAVADEGAPPGTQVGAPDSSVEPAGWHPGSSIPRAARGVEGAARAASLVGRRSIAGLRSGVTDDCVGFVRVVYESLGLELFSDRARVSDNGVKSIWRRAREVRAVRQSPHPGDLVFFRETYDRNHDGHRDDGLTHIGIVESIEPDGTVVFVHRGGSGIHRSRMNLRLPRVHRDDRGTVLNDYLRARTRRTRAYTTGELFSGFASPEKL